MFISSESLRHGEHHVLIIRVVGTLPDGSAANPLAHSMRDYLREQITEHHTGLIFDLTACDYRWGNSVLWFVGIPLQSRARMVATGDTAAALRELIASLGIHRVFPDLLHSSIQEALASLEP